MRLLWTLSMCGAFLGSATSRAHAESLAYHLEIVASDVVGDALTVGGIAAKDVTLGGVGLGLAIVGAPLIHSANGRHGRAASSFFLRAGAVFLLPSIVWLSDVNGGSAPSDRLWRWVVGLSAAMLLTEQVLEHFPLIRGDRANSMTMPLLQWSGSF